MKVLLTADTVGGVWTYALELAEALAPHGVEVILATLGAPLTAAQRGEVERLSNLTCYESDYRLEWMSDPWEDQAWASDWLLEIAGREAPDLVQLNSYGQAALGWGRPVLLVAHSCVLTWWRAVKGGAAPPSWERYRSLVGDALAAVDLVVAPTAALLEALEREYGSLHAGRVVPNGVDPTRFATGVKEPFVLGAGRIWDEAKNLAALAAVAPGLPWPVYLAGETGEPGRGGAAGEGEVRFVREAVESVARAPVGGSAALASAAGRVHYLGRLPGGELRGWLARAAVYALPARYEPFGLSALEAGLSGCALVLGDIPSLREVWDDAARYVPPSDTAAFQSVLEELLMDATARGEWGARARERASSYTAERMADSYLGIYRELLARNDMGGEVRARRGEAGCA